MQSRKIKLCLIITLGFYLTSLQAQKAILTSGGEASGNTGTLSYSIGQVVYQVHTGSNGSVAEGVQQPFEIQEVTGIENVFGVNLTISTFPNPVVENLTLSVENLEF